MWPRQGSTSGPVRHRGRAVAGQHGARQVAALGRHALLGATLWLSMASMPALVWTGPAQAQPARVAYTVVGDAIPAPLSATPGDPARGRTIVATRQTGLCLLCHTGPFPEERFQGSLAPDLSGAGTRWSTGQLRLRVVDARRLNPATVMPPYHRVEGLVQVGSAWRGQPLLTAQQVEDVVAFLATLKE